MFKRVHIRLTLLCAGIPAIITIILSLCYLYVSEQGLYKNRFQAFQNDMNTIATNLEQQSVISMEWLSKMETQGNYLFFVLDNGIPFLYNRLKDDIETSNRSKLLEESQAACRQMFEVTPSTPSNTYYNSYHLEYEFTSASTDTDYLGSVIFMGERSSSLQIYVLSSLESLKEQMRIQRFHFFLIDLSAVLLLAVFSWFFTGRLLQPIMESHEKQTRFIASASHELRTPLAVILSAAECCNTAPPEKQETLLKTIQQEGLRMSALVDDMLTLSASDNLRFSTQKQPTELDTLLMNCYEAFEPLAKEKSIDLSIRLPEEALPLCSVDPKRITQVLSILLHNAVSYTPEKGIIILSLSYRKNHFYLSVADNGIGVSEEDKKRIFDRFYRVEKSRSSKEHFGLGLSIAQEIVKAHGGSIDVTDTEGGGSTFTIML